MLEFAGLGPAPFCGQLLADLGADVVVVDRPRRAPVSLERSVERRGKRSIVLDLKQADGVALALRLAARSDMLIEGLRPGVMERLGLGPDACHGANPALIYGRMTGWGQAGPCAPMAGHDLTYIALTGALHAMGDADRAPAPPLNLVGDFGGGSLYLALGLLAVLNEVRRTGRGRVVDASIFDGVTSMMGMFRSWQAAGEWSPARGRNMLDGSAPFYRCYETKDGRYVAVGAIEPQFLAALLSGLDISREAYGDQMDPVRYPEQTALLAAKFLTRSRDAWADHFHGTDACVAPVLSLEEAALHPHAIARSALVEDGDITHPAPAPFLDGAPLPCNTRIPRDGEDTAEVLRELGLSEVEISAYRKGGSVA